MFQIQDTQHREWFTVVLLPHIGFPLTQYKVTTQEKAFEITMGLEDTPRGGETSLELEQVQYHLKKLTVKLQDMAKAKVLHENFWCTTCCIESHP
jgi:hypothetical protein